MEGIGQTTKGDEDEVTSEDAGNNFFIEGPSSIGKSRTEEAIRLLGELNERVEGKAVVWNPDDMVWQVSDFSDFSNIFESWKTPRQEFVQQL